MNEQSTGKPHALWTAIGDDDDDDDDDALQNWNRDC